MKGFYTFFALIISFGICFNSLYQFSIAEVALNWIFFGLLLILLGPFKFALPSSLEKCKDNFASMQTKKASHWTDIFGLNIKEWSSIFISLMPFTIIVIGISRCITHLAPVINFINYIALIVPSLLAMAIFFMILCVSYHKHINKKQVQPI